MLEGFNRCDSLSWVPSEAFVDEVQKLVVITSEHVGE